jgi:four helix bundle suffix protein
MTEKFIPKHGGYKNLYSYQKSEIIFDATVYFTKRFYTKGDRTIDQMVQAARSCKQNIVEGSSGSGGSKQSEIFLTNVARASLEELLADYRDFLRIRKLAEWHKNHPYAKRLRELNQDNYGNYETFRKGIEHENPAISANVIIGLIKVAAYLLDKQICRLQEDFIKEGGLRERMSRARRNHREKDVKDIKD